MSLPFDPGGFAEANHHQEVYEELQRVKQQRAELTAALRSRIDHCADRSCGEALSEPESCWQCKRDWKLLAALKRVEEKP